MKRLSVLFILFIIIACNKPEKNKVDKPNTAKKEKKIDSLLITKEEVSKLKYIEYGVDSKAENALGSWQSYGAIEKAITALKMADFSFFTEDNAVFKSTLKELSTTVPNDLDTEPIKARILALKTKLLKFEEIINLSTTNKNEQLTVIKEVFQSFSYLTLQINKKFEKEAQEIIKPEVL